MPTAHRAPRNVSRGWFWAGWSESARMCPYSLYSVIPAPRAPHNKHSVIPVHMRGQHLHSKLYTLYSIIPAPAGIIKKIRRTADSPHTEYKPDSVPPWAPFPTPSVASIISLHTMLPRCVYALYPPPCARDPLQGPI